MSDPQASPHSSKSSLEPVRVYAGGIYDLFNFSHARSFEQAKKLFPNTYLMVGCCNDELTQKFMGKTVMSEAERYESLWHCKWVDEVIPNAPWVIDQEFLDKHRIDYVVHDALPSTDATGQGGVDVYDVVRKASNFKQTEERIDGVSTSNLIMRVIKDYNQYVMRNLARGYTRKDLGISYAKEKQLQVSMGIRKLKEKVKHGVEPKWGTVAGLVHLQYEKWVESVNCWVTRFFKRFF